MARTSARLNSAGKRLAFWELVIVFFCMPAAATAVWNAVTEASSNALHQHASIPAAPIVPAAQPVTEVHNKPDKHHWKFMPATLMRTDTGRPALLYASPTTAHYLKAVGGSYEPLLAPWRNFFIRNGLPFTEISNLAPIKGSSDAVLILPSAVALSARERRQIAAFRQQGGNILTTWSAGVRNERGEWTGHAWMEDLFGIRVTGELAPGDAARFLNLSDNSPLSAGYPAGIRIWLEEASERPLRLSGGKPAALYLDWGRRAPPDTTEAAALYGELDAHHRHARWAIFGFPETSWGERTEQLSGLFANTLHWLSRGMLVTKATWPSPYQAAYIIAMDTEEGFSNAYDFARMMDDIGARATFYCLTSEAMRFPNLVRYLAKRHEIAYHGDVHTGFTNEPRATQELRLQRMMAEMRSLLDDSDTTLGFRAPEEKYDRTTEHLLHANGFRHHATDPNRTDARLPFFVGDDDKAPDSALVVIPRTQYDDINLLASASSSAAQQPLLHALITDFDIAMQSGALGFLSLHSQHFAKGSMLHSAMPKFLQHAAGHRQKVWIAGANEVADWWRERERLHYTVTANPDGFQLDVTIDGDSPLPRGGLVIAHKGAGSVIDVQAVKSGQPVPAIIMLDEFRSALVFDGMAAGSYSYRVTATASRVRGADRQKKLPAL